jgi:hypothetical protein
MKKLLPIMNLKAPTDNLYKFLAIFGLILIIFSILFKYYIFEKSRLLAYEALKNMANIESFNLNGLN